MAEAPNPATPEETVALHYARPPARPPSVLRVIGAVLLALLLGVAGQAVIGFVVGFAVAVQGVPDAAEGITQIFMTPAGFIAMALVAQMAMAGVTWINVSRGPGNWRDQLGFYRSHVPAWGLGAFVLGTIFAALVGVVLSTLVSNFFGSEDVAEKLWGQMTTISGVCFVLFVAIVPGVVEELFFRGYVQRRLLRRWRPAGAIVLTSLLFSVVHVDPAWAAFTIPIGLWLGVVAWRTGSVRPGILCHAGLNGLWNIYFISATKLEASDSAHLLAVALAAPAGLVGLIVGLIVLARMKPVSLREPDHPAEPLPVARPIGNEPATAAPLAVAPPADPNQPHP